MVTTDSKNLRRWPKWTLFVSFLLTVPVPYFMIVVGGLVPTLCIIYLAAQGVIVALPKFTAEGFWMLGILWGHVVIFAGLLYLIASGLAWFLFRLLSVRVARVLVVLSIITLLVLSTFEIYRVPGHNSAPPADIFRIIKSFAP
jgi:hypothetical protein